MNVQNYNGEPCIRDTKFAVRQLRTLLKNTKVDEILTSYPYLTKEDIEYVRDTTDDEIVLSLLPKAEVVVEPIVEVVAPVVNPEPTDKKEKNVENGLDEIGKKSEPKKEVAKAKVTKTTPKKTTKEVKPAAKKTAKKK